MNKVRQNFFTSLSYQIFILILFIIKANPFLNSRRFTSVLMAAAVLCGGIYSLVIIVKNRQKLIKNIYAYILAAFIGCYCITILVNYPVSFGENVKDILWFTIQIFTLFLIAFYSNQEQKDKNLKVLSWVYLCFTSIFAFISIFFVFLRKGGVESYGKWGFLSQRLFGLYRSPNYGALYCAISVIIAVGFFKASSKKIRVFLVFNCIVNFLYIVYSGSNTGRTALFAGIILFLIMLVLKSKDRKILMRNLSYSFCVLLLTVSLFQAVKITSAKIINHSYNGNSSMTTDSLPTDSGDFSDQEDIITFERTDYVEGSELGNGRIIHWKRALKVYPHYPVFGTSLRGYNHAVNSVFPNVSKIEKAVSLENDFITLLVCTGAVGLAIFFVFIIAALIKLINLIYKLFVDKDYENLDKFAYPLIIVLMIAMSAVFTDAIVFTNVLQSALFWISLGYILSYNTKAGGKNVEAIAREESLPK